jgi:hypothetical protein
MRGASSVSANGRQLSMAPRRETGSESPALSGLLAVKARQARKEPHRMHHSHQVHHHVMVGA